MCQAMRSEEDRRFRRQCQVAAGLSLITYVACSQAALRMHSSAMSLVLAGVAGAAFFTEMVAVGILVMRLRDEFQRALLTRSFIWATLITMALTTVWGFLELHARGAVPHLDIVWIPIMLLVFTAAAKVCIFRRYRPADE